MPGVIINTADLSKYTSLDLRKCQLCIHLHSEVLFSTLYQTKYSHFELLPVSMAFWSTETILKGDSEGEFPGRHIMLFCNHTSLKLSARERLVLLWLVPVMWEKSLLPSLFTLIFFKSTFSYIFKVHTAISPEGNCTSNSLNSSSTSMKAITKK